MRWNGQIGMCLTLLFHPARRLLERRFANVVEDRAGHTALHFDITGVKNARTTRLAGMICYVPVTRNIIKIRRFVIIQAPSHAALLGVIRMVVI